MSSMCAAAGFVDAAADAAASAVADPAAATVFKTVYLPTTMTVTMIEDSGDEHNIARRTAARD